MMEGAGKRGKRLNGFLRRQIRKRGKESRMVPEKQAYRTCQTAVSGYRNK